MAVDRVYMNALYPERFSKDDADELERALDDADGPAARGDPRRALRVHAARARSATQLQRLKQPRQLPGQDAAVHLQAHARRARRSSGSPGPLA